MTAGPEGLAKEIKSAELDAWNDKQVQQAADLRKAWDELVEGWSERPRPWQRRPRGGGAPGPDAAGAARSAPAPVQRTLRKGSTSATCCKPLEPTSTPAGGRAARLAIQRRSSPARPVLVDGQHAAARRVPGWRPTNMRWPLARGPEAEAGERRHDARHALTQRISS